MSKSEEKELGGLQKEAKNLGLCSCSKRKAVKGHCKTALLKRCHEMEWYRLRFKMNDVVGGKLIK